MLGELENQRVKEAKQRLRNFIVYTDMSDKDDYAEFCNWFLLLAPVRSTSPLADLSWTLGAQGAEKIWGRFLHTPDDV